MKLDLRNEMAQGSIEHDAMAIVGNGVNNRSHDEWNLYRIGWPYHIARPIHQKGLSEEIEEDCCQDM